MTLAITRDVSPRFNECELTHLARVPIDVARARLQHHEYVLALQELGCRVDELPAEADLPDSVFVEDAAVVLPEVALITRPGAESRRPEVESIAAALAPSRTLLRVREPATIDGGDVLVIGREIFIGLSTRTAAAALEQVRELLAPYGYGVHAAELHDCLHLKSAVTRVDDKTVLINPAWVGEDLFVAYARIEVHESEPYAANCLPLDGRVLFPEAFPKTMKRLEAHGYSIRAVPLDELAKAEGAITCCSLIVQE